MRVLSLARPAGSLRKAPSNEGKTTNNLQELRIFINFVNKEECVNLFGAYVHHLTSSLGIKFLVVNHSSINQKNCQVIPVQYKLSDFCEKFRALKHGVSQCETNCFKAQNGLEMIGYFAKSGSSCDKKHSKMMVVTLKAYFLSYYRHHLMLTIIVNYATCSSSSSKNAISFS